MPDYTDAKTYIPTLNFRVLVKENGEEVLQQQIECVNANCRTWRNVPRVKEKKNG